MIRNFPKRVAVRQVNNGWPYISQILIKYQENIVLEKYSIGKLIEPKSIVDITFLVQMHMHSMMIQITK